MGGLVVWTASLLVLIVASIEGKMFDSDSSLQGPPAVFPENDCFKSSAELTAWLLKVTSTQYYKRFVRPGVNESSSTPTPPLLVNVSVDMNSMASIDDINSEYTISLKIDLEWLDERLRLDDNVCNTTRLFTVPIEWYHLERIWFPRLGVSNIKDPETSIIQGEAKMTIGHYRNDGYIHIRWSLLLNLVCYLDFSLFPFDRQVCFIKLESRSYRKSDLRLVWHKEHPFRNLENFRMNGFRLVDYQLLDDSSPRCSTITGLALTERDIFGMDNLSQIVVRLVLARQWVNYFLEIYVPSILCVVSSWLSFWLSPSSAPARVSLGMTTMLTLVTSSHSTRDKLPRLGYIHALDVWITFCTILIFFSLIEFACVSYIERNCSCKKNGLEKKNREGSFQYFPKFGRFSVYPVETVEEVSSLGSEKCQNHCQKSCKGEMRAVCIDRLCRILFPAAFSIFNATYWAFYLLQRHKSDLAFQ